MEPMCQGKSCQLQAGDIGSENSVKSNQLADNIDRIWLGKVRETVSKNHEKEDESDTRCAKCDLFRSILRIFWKSFAASGLIQIVNYLILQPLLPLLQLVLVTNFDLDPDDDRRLEPQELAAHATYFVVTIVIIILLNRCSLDASRRVGSKISTGCSILVYRKILKLDSFVANLKHREIADIFEKLHFSYILMCFHQVWIIPIQICIIFAIMWKLFGIFSVIPVLIYVCFFMPIISALKVFIKRWNRDVVKRRTKRVDIMNECIAGIKTIKMYAWEEPCRKVIQTMRYYEIKIVRTLLYIISVFSVIRNSSASIITFSCIITYVFFGYHVYTNFTFTVIMYALILKNSITTVFPKSVEEITKITSTFRRVESILRLDEVKKMHPEGNHWPETQMYEKQMHPLMKLEKLSTKVLRNISVEVNHGELIVITGITGCGKTSLVQAILQEAPAISGNLLVNSLNNSVGQLSISYASQEPWLFSGSIRDNVLFFEDYHEERYEKVVEVCALTEDFKHLPGGDMTAVKRNGSHLSEELRVKINLARAVYRKSDLYLFDDPLSVLEPQTRNFIYIHCIGEFLRGKTRMITCQPMHLIRSADVIFFMNAVIGQNGMVESKGQYDDLLQMNFKFSMIMDSLKEEEIEADVKSLLFDSICSSELDSTSYTSTDDSTNDYEETSRSKSLWRVRRYFLSSSSVTSIVTIVLIFIASQAMIASTDVVLSIWMIQETISDGASNRSTKTADGSFAYGVLNSTLLFYFSKFDVDGALFSNAALNFYTSLVIISLTLCFIRNFLFMKINLCMAQAIHDSVFATIFHAPLSFFKSNSTEEIVQAFEKNMEIIDIQLPKKLLEIIQQILVTLSVITVLVIIDIWMIFPVLTISAVLLFVLSHYVNIFRSIQSNGKHHKTTVTEKLVETIDGLITIRSYGESRLNQLRGEFSHFEDNHLTFRNLAISKSFECGLCIDFCTIPFIATLCYTIILVNEDVMGATVGLALTQVVILIGLFNCTSNNFGSWIEIFEVLSNIISYENIPEEGTGGYCPPTVWPARGRITMRNVTARHQKQEKSALQDLNAMIEHGWRVGVIDSTGRSNRALIDVLFCLEPDSFDGEVKIDGRNIKLVSLFDLRSRLSIIPRNPVFFSGTVRFNMDPFSLETDESLYTTLKDVGLNDISLDMPVINGGRNLTVGQRQLICLAVALLKRNRVIIFHEATSDIDEFAQTIIKKTLRTKFRMQTVITLAHRLSSVIDNDRIMVIDDGFLVEFGCPYELLCDNPTGHFANSVNRTGEANADYLLRRAKIACRQNTNQYSLELASNDSSSINSCASIIYNT